MTDLTPEALADLRRKAERHIVYPLNRDECLALIERIDVHKSTLADLRRQMEELRAKGEWPVAKVVGERDAALARVADLEAVAEAARAYDQHFRLNLGCHTGCPEHEELRDALARLDANKDTE